MFIGSNIICMYRNSVKIDRIGNLKFLINGEGEKSQNLIKGESLIRVSRVEKFPEINKRACPFIRHLRVCSYCF